MTKTARLLPIVTASDDTGLLCRARGKAERKSGTALVLFQTKRLDPTISKNYAELNCLRWCLPKSMGTPMAAKHQFT
ncbi:MAG TPA: hypothetical protein PK110_13890 [Niabella sp.]|nr:hypothetical protein [Niabella sp.]